MLAHLAHRGIGGSEFHVVAVIHARARGTARGRVPDQRLKRARAVTETARVVVLLDDTQANVKGAGLLEEAEAGGVTRAHAHCRYGE